MTARVEVTLPEASQQAGHPRTYFSVRRDRFRYHEDPDVRFPLPTRRIGQVDVFDVAELLLWDERRLAREERRRAAAAKRRELREAARAARATKETTTP